MTRPNSGRARALIENSIEQKGLAYSCLYFFSSWTMFTQFRCAVSKLSFFRALFVSFVCVFLRMDLVFRCEDCIISIVIVNVIFAYLNFF